MSSYKKFHFIKRFVIIKKSASVTQKEKRIKGRDHSTIFSSIGAALNNLIILDG